MSNFIKLSLFAAATFLFTPAYAAFSPVAVSIIAPIEFPPSDFDVTGVRVSVLLGDHRTLHGIDIAGIGNITELDFVGLAVAGIFNSTKSNATILGLQLAGLTNVNTGKLRVVGIQASAIMNSNTAASDIIGLQVAVANMSGFTSIYGLQAGIFNKAQDVYGFQIGLVNMAESLHGLQIGLVNFNHKGLFTVSPILNAGF